MIRIRMMPVVGLAAGVAMFCAQAVQAGDPKQQVATAAAHAGMAAASTELKMVISHLQHTVNCLVGPASEGFDATQANPCKDQGFGAVQDAPMDKIPALQAVAKMARDGVAEADLTKAREKAAAIQAALGKISM